VRSWVAAIRSNISSKGGALRTGRLLQPKTGMLAMTVRSYLRDPKRPVVFLPVDLGYERIVEGQHLRRRVVGPWRSVKKVW
jgi:glycerol-3-phosphate O-acyltransferase